LNDEGKLTSLLYQEFRFFPAFLGGCIMLSFN